MYSSLTILFFSALLIASNSLWAAGDILTLDRVVCCYPDVRQLVECSASKSRQFYGLIYPRDRWYVKLVMALENAVRFLFRRSFRTYIHSPKEVEEILNLAGLRRFFHRHALTLEVALYGR
jgi:magnesium-protoporphyrin O-methyltransferase